MSFRACTGAWMAALSFCLLAGCTASSAPAPTRAMLGPLDYYPLLAGNAWSYDVDTGEPSTTLAITRVEGVDGGVAQVRTAKAIVHYEVLPDGIRVPPADAWLIRTPLRPGATWPAPGGRTAELVAVDAVAETPAGSFEGCAEVREVGGKLELEVRTVYCPGVGPVSVTSTMRSSVSERTLTVSARLRGYSVSLWPSDP